MIFPLYLVISNVTLNKQNINYLVLFISCHRITVLATVTSSGNNIAAVHMNTYANYINVLVSLFISVLVFVHMHFLINNYVHFTNVCEFSLMN